MTAGCGAFTPYQMVARAGDGDVSGDWLEFQYSAQKEIKYFFDQGYPPTSVLLHAVSTGLTLDRSLYLAIQADSSRAREFYSLALSMASSLPGWACGAGEVGGDYSPTYDVNDLPPQRTVAAVAERFFASNSRLAPFPPWPDGDFHMLAQVDELLELATDQYWYRPGPPQTAAGAHPRTAVLIALYRHDKSVVLDTTRSELERRKRAGIKRVPVVFYYNQQDQRPVGQLADDANLEVVLDKFFQQGIQLTPVPMWDVGDHHLMVDAGELTEIFDIPDQTAIPQARLARLNMEMQNAPFQNRPVMITLLRDGNYRRLAEPDRIRIAMDVGIQRFPVVFFYHGIERLACSAPASCIQRLCAAVTCAGGDRGVCETQPDPVPAMVPVGGGGGFQEEIPPPPPPPQPPSPS
jgi:hypothetical protein